MGVTDQHVLHTACCGGGSSSAFAPLPLPKECNAILWREARAAPSAP
eukprot:CAMPEP_0119311510 /NCGR_PEP_ID=MMETSP1333-20130426/22700_1 /TAXON_ID=418940 /ORGANISM="Scyphosphaera apsteinii, Strain RCC1455" /LENGTH=46 /DNA_ID= /DNA_START= /DNA_END= /DNA_ORIENTATION=